MSMILFVMSLPQWERSAAHSTNNVRQRKSFSVNGGIRFIKDAARMSRRLVVLDAGVGTKRLKVRVVLPVDADFGDEAVRAGKVRAGKEHVAA
jgi:hypothetical protein